MVGQSVVGGVKLESPVSRPETCRRTPRGFSAGSLSTIASIPVGLTFAATSGGVTNIFKPLSTPAQAIYEVSLLVLAICAGIFLVVAGLLIYTLFRFRHPGGRRRFAGPSARWCGHPSNPRPVDPASDSRRRQHARLRQESGAAGSDRPRGFMQTLRPANVPAARDSAR